MSWCAFRQMTHSQTERMFATIVWPSLTAHDLWRWLLLGMGVALIAHGLFSKHMRMRDPSTLSGAWKGKIVTKQWQILFMRTLFVVVGIATVAFAFGSALDTPLKSK